MGKDLAIYDKVLQIAQVVFEKLCENEHFALHIEENRFMSTSDFVDKKRRLLWVDNLDNDFINQMNTVEVDGYCCQFPNRAVFNVLCAFERITHKKAVFAYEKKISDELEYTMDIILDNPTKAKGLAKLCSKEAIRPAMNHVFMDVNTVNNTYSFVGSDGYKLAVITNHIENIKQVGTDDEMKQALFSPTTWTKICDMAQKNNGKVSLKVCGRPKSRFGDVLPYNDVMVTDGNTILYSCQCEYKFPKWRNAHQFSENEVLFTDKAAKAFSKFVKMACKQRYDIDRLVCVSWYKGNHLLYAETPNGELSETFELQRPAQSTKYSAYDPKNIGSFEVKGLDISDGIGIFVTDIFDYAVCMSKYLRDDVAYSVPEDVIRKREMMHGFSQHTPKIASKPKAVNPTAKRTKQKVNAKQSTATTQPLTPAERLRLLLMAMQKVA